MSKPKEQSTSVKISRSQANDLAVVVARMQKNADQVEKNILRAEQLLEADAEREKKKQQFMHQKENSEKLGQAEELLKDLFLDADKVKKLRHPQSREIEKDVKNLHERWAKDCANYRDLYDQVQDLDLKPGVDWGSMLDEKLDVLMSQRYGPKLSDVEKQIAEHNLFDQEVAAYGSQLLPALGKNTSLRDKYSQVLESSQHRRNHLASLRDYLQSCNNELVYLSGQQERILQRDWSDHMVDPAGVRIEYEKFKSDGLLAHEQEVGQLLEHGELLMEGNHPGSPAVKVHRDTVQAEWQAFLNLCLAQEAHLDNIDLYKKFQLDAEMLSESLQRLSSNLEPKSLNNKSNPEILLTLEADEPAVHRSEGRLASLRERSRKVPPLRLRRVQPSKAVTVLSLCDWMDEDVVTRGEKLTLKSNSLNNMWEVEDSAGQVRTLPGACFVIEPPDIEALQTVDSLDRKLRELKSHRAAVVASLKTPLVEVDHPKKAAVLQSSPDDLKAAELVTGIDRIIRALDESEKEVLDRLRTPLDTSNPAQDLAKRQQAHEKSVLTVRTLESDKSTVQRKADPILAKRTLGPNASVLPLKLSTASRKIDNIQGILELYDKKAMAAMFLERQIKKVEGTVSGFEEKLATDGTIFNEPAALQSRIKNLQETQTDAALAKEDLVKLGKDLDLTKKACSPVQQAFGEFCPDIRRQENKVKTLKNRYTSVNNQLQERLVLLKQAVNKNQNFQFAASSLDYSLMNLPNISAAPSDGIAQINTKQKLQMKVVDDIEKKSSDLAQIKDLSKDLQGLLNEYEINSKSFRRTLYEEDEEDPALDMEEESVLIKPRTLAQRVQRTERELLNLYSEVSAANKERLNQLETAKDIMARNEENISQVVVSQQLQLQNQKMDQENSETLKRELKEEISRRIHAERDLETYRKRFVSLKSRRGVERVEEKEVVRYYRDPKLEQEIKSLNDKIHEEEMKRSRTRSEIEVINEKKMTVELQLTNVEPKLVTKVVTEYERDPKLEKEAVRIRDEMQRIRNELQIKATETVQVKSELTLLSQQKPQIAEKIVKKEVVRLEKDPEMLKAVLRFQNAIAEEELQSKSVHDNIFSIRSQINSLERVLPTIQPKTVTKVVKQVQQDPEMLEESRKLKMILEEEKDENVILMKDLTTLQLRYGELEMLKPKVELKEIINEIYQVDPETEVELVRLKKQLQDLNRSRSEAEKEIDEVMVTLTALRSQKPKVEYKEVTNEIIKQEKSPEVARELQRLNNNVSRLRVNYTTTLELLSHLRKERDELKEEKSKVEMKVVTKELIKYEDDPLLLKGADRLRRDVREEIQERRKLEECLFELQNQYISLERQKPEEKIITEPVIRLQKDPNQLLQHENLNRTLDDEMKARRKLESEVRHLRSVIQDKETTLSKTDDRQKKIQVEAELRQIRARILELENAPPPVEEKIIIEEVLKVEKDPKLEKLTDGVRTNLDSETNKIADLEREIRNLELRLELLQKEKSTEKIVYREVVRVEKDPAVEEERDRLRDLVSHERHLRRDQEDGIQNINLKINHLQTSSSITSQEKLQLTALREELEKEKEDLLKQLQGQEYQRQSISLSFQHQSKLMSERNQLARQKSLKTSTEIERLEKQIIDEKDKIHQREALITDLKNSIKREDHSETHTRETNLSTKISILDPETGRDLSPYDAYVSGLIDRGHYLHLAELECDWEEITNSSPDGDTTILQDRKSGRQYSITEALKDGRLSQIDLARYKEGKLTISELALLVTGETQKPYIPPLQPKLPPKSIPSTPTSPLNSMPPSLRTSYPSLTSRLNGSLSNLNSRSSGSLSNLNSWSSGSLSNLNSWSSGSLTNLNSLTSDEQFPISGIYDVTTDSRMSIRSALTRRLIDPDTGLKLLEAQAASGGIVDLSKKDKLSVHKAVEHNLIDSSQMYRLLNAQKAFTGVEDPVTKERLSIGEAAQKGYMAQENAKRYLEAQYLTGGLVNPSKAGRLSVQDAVTTKMIDSKVAEELKDEASHTKELIDPISQEKITYKQAMDRCRKDTATGLLLLPTASTDASNTPSYSNYRFNSSYSNK